MSGPISTILNCSPCRTGYMITCPFGPIHAVPTSELMISVSTGWLSPLSVCRSKMALYAMSPVSVGGDGWPRIWSRVVDQSPVYPVNVSFDRKLDWSHSPSAPMITSPECTELSWRCTSVFSKSIFWAKASSLISAPRRTASSHSTLW